MELLNEIAAWAWARHHNPLSWYIRPLFLLPYVAFAWRHSLRGIFATLLALATSMAWFPAPEHPDPRIEAFLAMERDFILGPLTVGKLAGLLAAPAAMAALALAFWRRSIAWGVTTLVAIALTKVAWSVAQAGAAGWSVAAPAFVGLAACVVAVLAFHRLRGRRGSPPSPRTAPR